MAKHKHAELWWTNKPPINCMVQLEHDISLMYNVSIIILAFIHAAEYT